MNAFKSAVFGSSESINALIASRHASDGEERPIVDADGRDTHPVTPPASPIRRSESLRPILEEEASIDTDTSQRVNFASCWLCHPQRVGHRSIALFLMCLMGFGSYFCFDSPGALQDEIKEVMKITTFQFSNLYALYSWPNVVLPIFGGVLIDGWLGLRNSATFFSLTLVIGQALVALGAYTRTFSYMEVGRFIFGIGGESLAVAQNTYASLWFTGSTLNMVFGLQLSITRLGSTANFQIMGPLYHALAANNVSSSSALPDDVDREVGHDNGLFHSLSNSDALGFTMLIAGLSCVMSLLATIILGMIDKRAEHIISRLKAAKQLESGLPSRIVESPDESDMSSESSVSCADMTRFDARFWLLTVICVAYYVSIFPFISLGQVFFMQKYAMSAASANFINGLIYLLSAILSPIIGLGVDKIGRNLTAVLMSVVATIVGHAVLAYTTLAPYFPVALMGMAYSTLASALWPLVTLIVPLSRQGTAFGVMQSIQNLGLALVSMAAGKIVDQFGYFWLETFYIGWLMLALVGSVVLIFLDLRRESGLLNMNATNRELFIRIRDEREAAIRSLQRQMLQDEDGNDRIAGQPSTRDDSIY